MLIDINTWIGHWPFRQLRHNNVAALLKKMDAKGIDRAVVASADAVLYRYPHPANQDLARQVRRHRDRLIPVAALNPRFPGWEEDLRRCAEDLGMAGLRLYPQYHDYNLTEPAALDLVDAAGERDFVLQVPQRIEDRRTRHPWDLARDLGHQDFQLALEARPRRRWMFLNALGLDGARLPRDASYVVDISRMTSLLQRNIQRFIDTAGADKLAFGTGMCFSVPDPALLKLEVLDRPQRVKDRIAWRNAARLLGLKPR